MLLAIALTYILVYGDSQTRARVYKPEMKRIKQEQRPLERRESELDHEIDALTDRDEGRALTAAQENQVRDLL
jgi:hypothetical protein